MNLCASAARRLAPPASAPQCSHAPSRHRPLVPCLSPIFRIRRLESSAASTPPTSASQPDSDRPHLEQDVSIVPPSSHAPRQRKPQDNKARWPERVKAGDLQETLEVHRAANRASLIRRVNIWGRDDAHARLEQNPPVSPPQQTADSEGRTDSELDALIDSLADKPVLSRKELQATLSALRARRATFNAGPNPAEVKDLSRIQGRWCFQQWLRPTQERTAEPWTSVSSYSATDSRLRVEQELQAFTSYLRPTEYEQQLAADLYDYVAGKIGRELTTVRIQLHGSRATGLAQVSSDLDICLSHPLFHQVEGRGPSASHPEARNLGLRALERLQTIFDGDERITFLELRHARVPVVRMRDEFSRLEIQVIANVATGASVDLTRFLVQSHPQVVPIFTVLRQAFQMRGLFNVMRGFLGSYQLFSMVVAALNHDPAPSRDLATAFEKVLKFWAHADLGSHGFTVEPHLVFSKWDTTSVDKLLYAQPNNFYLQGVLGLIKHNKSQLKTLKKRPTRRGTPPAQPLWHEDMLILQDAADPSNDLGSKSFNIHKVLAVWRSLTHRYLSVLGMWQRLSEEQRSTSDKLLLEPFIMANYTRFDNRRASIGRKRLDEHLASGTSASTVETQSPEPIRPREDTPHTGHG